MVAKFNYNRMEKVADRLLNRFNETPFTVEREVGDSMVDGEYVAGTVSTFSATGVIVPYVQRQINNTTILAGDLQATVRRDYMPLNSDIFIIDGGKYKIVNIETFKPSDSVLCYRVQLRK